MDQGSYSRPDGRGQPSLSSSSAANSNYQVNVSRQKTKKWVEAKSQNYDGDDWGADEYDEDEVEPPLPLAPQGPQHGVSHGAHNLPSLHVQTSQPSQPPQNSQPYPPPQSRPPPPANAQPRQVSDPPSSAHPGSAVPHSAGGFQPQSASSAYALSPRSPPDSLPSTTPQAATANKPLPFVRPSDIYRRMEEEKSRGSSDSSRPSADLGSNLSKQSSASPARTAAEPVRPQPPTAPVPAPAPAPRIDSHANVYQDLTNATANKAPPQPSFSSPPRSDVPVSQFTTPKRDVAPGVAEDESKRLSTSPKLPDLARMSVFGADFFSSGGFSSSLSSQQIAEQDIPEVPRVAPELKVDKPTTHKTNDSPADAAEVSSVQKQAAPAAPVAMESAPIEHEIIAPTVYQAPGPAPTMAEPTPSATVAEPQSTADPAKQAAARASIDTASSSRSAASAADITPTKPLNVRKEESPVRSFEPPPPLQREPTFGTDTSSPVKESDMLRDEIIKTLNSPAQPGKETLESSPADNERKPSQSRTRDSTYTLQDYDSYWADTDTVPEVPPQPDQSQPKTMSIVPEEAAEIVAADESKPALISKAPESTKSTERDEPAVIPPPPPTEAVLQPTAPAPAPASQHSSSPAVSQVSQSTAAQQPVEASIVSPASTDLRRRFSWEAEDASRPPQTALGAAPPAASIASTAPPVPAPAVTQAPAPALAAAAVPPTENTSQPEITSPREPQSGPPFGASAGIAAGAAVGAAAAVGAGITAVTATSSNSQESKRLSLADEKALSATTTNEIFSPTADHPALRLSEPAPVPVLSMPRSSGATVTPFKDILSLNNSTERVAKFNETRVAFAVMDTGLDRWLTNLHQDHPEHHSKSFNSYQPAAAPAGVPLGAQQPAQQPYYQQYLNASAPGSGSSPGRRIGGISMPSHVGGSTFGHSGNQIGTKSKELMQSAGKMGKGLFSKGKNKLRGDKGETHPQQPPPPPPAQTKAKHDRSGSWAVLSSKLRTEFSSSKDHEQQHQQHHQQPHEEEYYAAPRASMTVAPQIPVPEPVSPLLREATPDRSFPAAQTASGQRRSDYPTGAVSAPLSSATSSSIPAAGHQIRVVPSEPASHGPVVGAPAVPPPVAEDSGVGMLQQPDESDDAPKRQSSFVGLPPIRRSSTFGMKSKARRAAERFPLDEEEDNGVPGLPTSDVMEHPASEPEAPQQLTRREHLPGATVVQAVPSLQPPTTTTDKDGIVLHHQPVSAEHSPERPAVQPVMAATPSQPPTMRPSQPPHPPVMLHPGQSGPWRLEESHLAEPLHQAKNRSGHSPISPPMNYGFDKETGQMPPPPVPANNNMRQRNTADVPPSSAQRYPGLFAPRPDQELTPQQQRQMSNPQAYYEEMANPRHSGSEFAIPGVGPPTEERGRAKRNSGIFKEIGDKIARATSRDRKNSFADASRPPTDAYTDEASESSFGTEEMQDRKKKRRSSILNSLTGRASMDQGSRQSFSALQRSQTEAAVANSSSEDLGSARKRSVFGGVMAGFSGNKNAPTSGLANQQSAADDEPQLTPKKKRFSAITKAFQRPNQERPSSGLSLEPTESAGSSQNPNARSGILSSMPFRNRDRSDSAAQMDPAGSEHNRRASFSNLLSSLTGNKGQQQQQQQQHPDHQYQQYQNQPSTPSRSFAANDLPQDIPSAPRQQHAADDFPTPNRDAGAPPPTLPAQFLDRPQPLFAADENKWGIDRPPTAATVTASERPKTDAGESIASSAAMVPSISSLPLPFAAATAETSAKRDDPVAPSEVSDSETDIAETSRKPSDVTPSVMTGADEESEDMTRQDTNVSQVTPSVVTDLPRPDEPQEHTPTAQYPNSPGGYYTHNSGTPGAAPLSAGPQGYPQAQSQGPVHHQQDPRRSLTGPAYGPGMGQAPPGPQYGQQQHQQYMQGGFAQPAQPSEPSGASSNRWKGLKTKMAGQMASISQSSPGSKSQDKQEKSDKSASGDKLFNAFKRLSKQQSPSSGPGPADAPQSPGAQARSKRLSNAQPPVMTPVMTQLPEGMQPAPQGGEMSPGFRVFPRNQGQPVMGQSQQMPPHMQHQQMPPHMQHQQMPPHMQHQQMPPHIQHQQMHPQQTHMGLGYHPQQGHPQQQLSMYMQQQQQQQKQVEPQYAAVPVPQGYNSAYNQDGAQPQSMYNVSRQYSQHQTPYQQQQHYASHYQPHGQQTGGYQQHGNGFEHSQPQAPLSDARRESQPHEPLSQQVSATGSELLSPLTQRSGSLPLSPTSDEPRSPHAALTREALAQQDARKDLQAHHLRPEESRTSLGPSNSNRVSQVSNDSGRQRPSPKSQQSPAVSHKQLQAAAGTAASAATAVAAAVAVSPDHEPHATAASISPPIGSSPDLASPSNGTATASHAVTILSPASPAPAEPLSKDLTGESKGNISDDSVEKNMTSKPDDLKITTVASGHFAELEDTAEARQRTIRLDGQEEKIAYDPEEENPKMSATSYPGQEWNPYGEPGFSDWQE